MSADLLLPLSACPGLDASGLWVRDTNPAGYRRLVVETDDGEAPSRAIVLERTDRVPEPVERGELLLDLADASTRDRVARLVAERLGKAIDSTAPLWYQYSESWELYTWESEKDVIFVRPVGTYSRAYGPIVPALAEVDPADERTLPDGSRWADARALLLVAQHLGRTP